MNYKKLVGGTGAAILIIVSTLLLSTGSTRCTEGWIPTDFEGIMFCESRNLFRACDSLSSSRITCYHIKDSAQILEDNQIDYSKYHFDWTLSNDDPDWTSNLNSISFAKNGSIILNYSAKYVGNDSENVQVWIKDEFRNKVLVDNVSFSEIINKGTNFTSYSNNFELHIGKTSDVYNITITGVGANNFSSGTGKFVGFNSSLGGVSFLQDDVYRQFGSGSGYNTSGIVFAASLDSNVSGIDKSIYGTPCTTGALSISTNPTVNQSLYWNGAQGTHYCDDGPQLSFGDASNDRPFSGCLWVNMTAEDNNRFILKYTSSPNNIEWLFGTGAGDQIVFQLFDGGTTNRLNVIGTDDLSAAYHQKNTYFCFTYNASGAQKGMEVYANGVKLPSTKTMSGTYVAMHDTNTRIDIGVSLYDGAKYSAAILDEVTIWNRSLSPDEIKYFMNQKYKYVERGNFTNTVLDVGSEANFTRINWTSSIPANTNLTFYVQSCNDSLCDGEDWSLVSNPNNLNLETNQYFRYYTMFKGNFTSTPTLFNVTVSYSFVGNITGPRINDLGSSSVGIDFLGVNCTGIPGSESITYYNLSLNGSSIISSNDCNAFFTSLIPGNTYNLTVMAYDSVNNLAGFNSTLLTIKSEVSRDITFQGNMLGKWVYQIKQLWKITTKKLFFESDDGSTSYKIFVNNSDLQFSNNNSGDYKFDNNVSVQGIINDGWYCFNSSCTSYIFFNGTEVIVND